MASLTPSRLLLARRRRGLSLTALARLSGVSVRSLTTFENGHRTPPDATLRRIAAALEITVEFLAAGDLEEIPVLAPSFRALSKMTASQRGVSLSYGRLAIDLNEWLEERFILPGPDVPRLENDRLGPATAARIVRERWALGERPVGNMIHTVEAHGVRVFSLPEELSAVDAFSLWWRGTPYVLLNPRKSAERGRFDVAHELGHLVLHGDHESPPTRTREQDANRFAAALLMPQSDVLAGGLTHATVDRILAAKHRWGVSAMALAHRLGELGLLTEWEYRSTCVQLSQLGYRRAEPGGAVRESSQLLDKAFRSLREGGASPADVARALKVFPAELNRYVFGLVPTSVSGGGSTSSPRRPDLRLLEA